ncbi:MAG: phasin, PhaP [Antarcticimicrobium sp.]|uniref:phasin, PhaP n=1 Tax=Antarcticimicrobium sp. TaxID=2824147 RepID=UPI00261F997F|nr:phasin, PhaP [Antarcticimicrobium sp.]MDF1718954.1 phasin, PhaP [Antarcticimicrobium sp.]
MTNKDYSEILKDMMSAFPVDTSAMDEAFKTSAALSEKLSGVALEAAGKSAELSSHWAQDTLAKVNEIAKAKAEPADYAKAMSDFASASAEVAAENMAAFAEIAKKVQMDTVELMVSAGKDMGQEASAAMQKAASDMTAAAKPAAAAKKPAARAK